jgi:hypothetical protein
MIKAMIAALCALLCLQAAAGELSETFARPGGA